MSAPKVTVLSGKRANIVVAQELRFSQSYDIESTVSSGGGDSSCVITRVRHKISLLRILGLKWL